MANYAKRNAKSIALVLKMLNVEGVNSTPQLCKYLRKHFRICNAQKKNSFIQKEDFFVIEMYPQSIISTAMSKKNWTQIEGKLHLTGQSRSAAEFNKRTLTISLKMQSTRKKLN